MKILIGTDGSKFSEAAIAKCAEMFVRPEDSEITVLSVYEKLGAMAGEPFGVSREYYAQAESAAKKLAETAVSQAADNLRTLFPNMKREISTSVQRGRAGRLIVEIAEESKVDLIVLGSHGHGFWGRNFLGSVSDSVVHHAHCSVLVVRDPDLCGADEEQ